MNLLIRWLKYEYKPNLNENLTLKDFKYKHFVWLFGLSVIFFGIAFLVKQFVPENIWYSIAYYPYSGRFEKYNEDYLFLYNLYGYLVGVGAVIFSFKIVQFLRNPK